MHRTIDYFGFSPPTTKGATPDFQLWLQECTVKPVHYGVIRKIDFYEILLLLTQSQFNHREFHIPTHPYITDQLRVDFSIQSSIPDQIYNPLFSIIRWHVQFVSQHTAKIKHIYSSIDINTMQVRNKLNYMEWFLYLGYRHMPCTEFTIRKYQIGN